ncbi:uncharacterized protein FOMMEDRAFT_156848 [Fomitiporia mediterranea MF3/22]|uniref:uncharacterized protein n=1 Tax=Fomitiporia mediterranea (strain MF3/22) TaxID=694068 RepID=UPI0004407BEA|nr:uncharacterized protein FOMMEDRAFT_156848 [Fomitiporia mediterranea MF3/22]EJD03440.1 hypothetical protein FOMMEDRAFT_156848 [Fomitiporia mediterranea MF3/22]
MQSDPESAIRTNVCILIGRLGPSLGYNTKKEVLVPAFVRAFKDLSVQARVAGLMAFMIMIDCFDAEGLATKGIPCISFPLIDKEKHLKPWTLFIKKMESHEASMPETALNANGQPNVILPVHAGQNALVNSTSNAASALAGWAKSSLTKKLTSRDLQSTMTMSTPDRPGSISPSPTLNGLTSMSTGAGPLSVKTPSSSKFSSPGAPSSSIIKGHSMQLDDWTAFESGLAKNASAAASTLGFDETPVFSTPTLSVDEDAWGGDLHTLQPTRSHPSALTTSTNSLQKSKSPPIQAKSPSTLPEKSLSPNMTVSPPWAVSPAASSIPGTPIAAPMMKEEKAVEMARQKEKQKQCIAMLKE